jgi:tetratricopeptide (TPR) repeat protein
MPKRGLELIKRAMRVCPLYRPGFLRVLAQAYRFSGNPEAAVDAFRESLKRESSYLAPHVNLTSVLGELGRIDEARQAACEILRLAPDFSIGNYMEGLSYRNTKDSQRVEEGLRQAGLPD